MPIYDYIRHTTWKIPFFIYFSYLFSVIFSFHVIERRGLRLSWVFGAPQHALLGVAFVHHRMRHDFFPKRLMLCDAAPSNCLTQTRYWRYSGLSSCSINSCNQQLANYGKKKHLLNIYSNVKTWIEANGSLNYHTV